MSMYVLHEVCKECMLRKPVLWSCAPAFELQYCADCLEEVVQLIRKNEELFSRE